MNLWSLRGKNKEVFLLIFNNFKGIKERNISDVVEKVSLWRKLYDGFSDEHGRYVFLLRKV
jgi:hypothetical protein